MKVSEACRIRVSIRAFKPDAVSGRVIRQILEHAHRGSPSGGNLQPWRVYALSGKPLADLKGMIAKMPLGQPEYAVYPPDLWDPFRSRREACGEDLYGKLGIGRDEKIRRARQFARNARLFDAPVGLFFALDRRLGPPQWSDVGMFMQTIMLLAVEHGLATCAQEFWAHYAQAIAPFVDMPEDHILFSGMALGYPDPTAPINELRTRREPFAQYAAMRGFDED